MFNEELKEEAIREMERANSKYTVTFRSAVQGMDRLYESRKRAVNTIMEVEKYMISLAHRPRGFETRINMINVRYTEFNKKIEKIKTMSEEEQRSNGGTYGMMAAGLGGMAFTPTALMAVAMTFGTASTGTAIASLSGAAATNAALAWLGSGSLALGGLGGMAGGQAILTAAGPIGWVIGGTALLGSAIAKTKSNTDIADKAESTTRAILRETERMKEVQVRVIGWQKETMKLSVELTKKLMTLKRKKDYMLYTETEKRELASLINLTEVLSRKLGDKI